MLSRAFALLVCTAGISLAAEYPTAYEALRVVGTQMNRDYVNRVISITGTDGDPQPASWKILLADKRAAGGVREVEVRNGRLLEQRAPKRNLVGTADGATINTSKLNLDSSGAFAVANHTADQSHTLFATVSYSLRTDDRGYPTWIVTLRDQAERPVGTIHIGANKGTVTRVEGMYRGTNMAQVEQDNRTVERGPARDREIDREPEMDRGRDRDRDADTSDEDDHDDNFVKRSIKQAFRRTRSDAERMFQRVQRSFDRYFYRD